MNSPTTETFDVIVIGGGPGGSTAATLTAKQGHRVLLLEKDTFPRHQIGESLLPSTIHGIAPLLGVADKLREANFTVKNGGTFRWGTDPEPWTFLFAVWPGFRGAATTAYNVERSKFDKILLDNSRANGVDVRESCTVQEVTEDGDRVTGVRYVDAKGDEHVATSQYVVDAAGNRSRTYRTVGGERRYSDFFRNVALFGYFTGGKRLPAPNSGNILCAAFDDGWFWYIPLTDELTSVGVVVHSERAEKIQGDPDQAMSRLVDSCPLIKEYLDGATRVTTGQYGEFRVRKDYSYSHTKFWKPGMVLVGDSACFVDPVLSSGVHLATYSGLLAARSINSSIAGRVDEKDAFTEFERRYRREYGVFYEFLAAFYGVQSSEHSYYWEAKKVTNSGLKDLEAFAGLVGGFASGESALIEPEEKLAKAAPRLSKLLSGEGQMDDEYTQVAGQVVATAMGQGVDHLLTQARQGDGDAQPEAPVFPDGLVSTVDGAYWAYPSS